MIFFAYVLKTGFSYPSTACHHERATCQLTGIPAFSLSLSFSFPFTFVFAFTFAFTFSFFFAYSSPLSSHHFPPLLHLLSHPEAFPLLPPPRAGRADNFSFSNSVSVRSLLRFYLLHLPGDHGVRGYGTRRLQNIRSHSSFIFHRSNTPLHCQSLFPKVWVCFTAPFHTP